MPHIFFTVGPKTETLASAYLDELKANPGKAGAHLRAFLTPEVLKDWFDKELKDLTVRQLISTLMSTKQARLRPEVDVRADPDVDWTLTELQILSNVSLHCLDAKAYNNGARALRQAWKDFPEPPHEHIIFINGAVFTSSIPGVSYDTPALIVDGHIKPETLFLHYEEKLVPLLIELNKAAAERGENVVLNIPDLSAVNVTGPYESQIRTALPGVLRKIIETHASKLTHIHTVTYDPIYALGIEEEDKTTDIPAGTDRKIRFQIKPFETEAEKKGPLEFPEGIIKEQIEAQHLVITKLVVGSPVSWPGNDIWVNHSDTDESATFAATNALSKMLASGTLVITKPDAAYQVKYNPSTGCEQFCKNVEGEDKFFEHREMMGVLGLKFVAHSYNILTVDYLEKPGLAEGYGTHGFWGSSKPEGGDDIAPGASPEPLHK